MLQKQAIEEVTDHRSPGFYGRLFLVPKSSGGWRPVLDLSPLNEFLQKIPFRMETTTSIREAMHPGDWAASIDLSDAYFHILVHHHDRKWLRFAWGSKVFQFRALPFGLSLAPWVFTRVTRELVMMAHSRGIRLRAYLDDWLILADSKEACYSQVAFMWSLCSQLGFRINAQKSEPTPARSFLFLGMEFDTVRWTVKPAPHRTDRLSQQLSHLRQAPQASARLLSSLLGLFESLAPIVPLGHLHKRPLQRLFRQRWSQRTQPWDAPIPLGLWFNQATSQWTDPSWLSQGVPIVPPPPEEELFTDASLSGWGAHVAHLTAAGPWTAPQRLWHINRLELEAVLLALREFLPFVKGKRVLLCTDNTTVAAYINHQGGSQSVPLSLRTEELLLWCQTYHISLVAKHVPGKLNILADALSRPHMVIQTEWTLTQKVLGTIWSLWFKPMVDLFATRFNHRLPLYVSPVPDPNALAVDALTIEWSSLLAYAFPPLPIMGKVVRKAKVDRATLILVAPNWPAQPWYPDLLALTHLPPLKLEVGPRDLVQPRSGTPHANPGILNLHAWMLCGSRCQH